MDPAVDARRNAQDVLVEALVMARGCGALLSTWSHVSAAVVYFAPFNQHNVGVLEPVGQALPGGHAEHCSAEERPVALL